MSGIAGKYFFNKNRYNNNDLEKMMHSIHHRGPDSSGTYKNTRVSLGAQTLHIVDIEHSHHPLYNENRTIILFATGKIYNYKDFIPDLLSKGHVFTTKNDSEVIIHLYEEYGIDFVSQLNGMFAFCLYDINSDTMFIARDRVGIKPMYYHVSHDSLIFCSEIKGIIASDDVVAAEEKDVLGEYLCFRYLANFRTFFSSIHALIPGHYIKITPAGYDLIGFFDRSAYILDDHGQDFVEKINSVLSSSVDRQMLADVQLGAQLSGGVDSSLISSLASKIMPGLNTFTVGFFEKSYDESTFAQLLTRHIPIEYHQIKVDGEEFANNLPQVIWFHDEPLCHANSVHMYLMCRYARQYVKVLLAGEGADELFAGYPRYMICRFGEMYNRLDSRLAWLIKSLLQVFPFRKVKKIVSNLGLSAQELLMWNSCFATKEKVSWLMDTEEVSFKEREKLVSEMWNEQLSLFDNLLLYEQQSYAQPTLMRQDKMSMAASVESRVPFLDNEVLSLANSIPYQYKIRNFTPKHILKKVAEFHVPKKIIYKKKVGFGVPVDQWLKDSHGLGRYLDLLRDVSRNMDGVNSSKVEQLITEHVHSENNHADILWPLVNYAIWKDQFFN
ncbi:MAG: asparagine synthase (glutamine-hydrolyzing) [Desulfobulbus oligotrophicus]|jgi:asparagine synthase (glutamine-hydrolysing)|nr:asparagine synthase (glutamine-hydrolyzing) [Desulfobulbus oligotrophicus]